MSYLWTLLLPAVVLAGLVFVVMIGRRRHTTRGRVDAPAPGSPHSPLAGEPKEAPQRNTGTTHAKQH